MGKIITIGREFGSGGRELGRKLAEELGWEYYDKEIITEIAKKTSLSEKYVQSVIENNPHDLFPITVAHTFSYVDVYSIQQKQAIYKEKEEVLKEMATKSNCVIVGRCSEHILKEFNPFKIFVYADMDSKIKRCLERNTGRNDLTVKKVKKYIKSIDKKRAKYHKFFTGKTWGAKLNYDICVNTTNANISEIAKHLAGYVKTL